MNEKRPVADEKWQDPAELVNQLQHVMSYVLTGRAFQYARKQGATRQCRVGARSNNASERTVYLTGPEDEHMAVSGTVHDTPLADRAPAVSQSAVSIMTPDGWLVYRCKIGSRDEGQIMRVHGTNIHQYDDSVEYTLQLTPDTYKEEDRQELQSILDLVSQAHLHTDIPPKAEAQPKRRKVCDKLAQLATKILDTPLGVLSQSGAPQSAHPGESTK